MDLLREMFFSAWVAFAVPAVVLLACAEVGFRLGMRVHRARDEAARSTIGGIQGAVLGLLGLLLGFTFAIAAGRFDERRLLVVKDANAIGTTYLRASLLPDAHVEPVRDLLRRYTALRIEAYSKLDDLVKRAKVLAYSAELQRALWDHAVAAAKESPTVTVSLFVNALNETIDTEAERLAAGRATIPITIWLLLLIVAALGCLTSSYAAGAAGERTAFSSYVLPLLIAVVILLIYDVMQPRQGMIGVSQQPLVDLLASMAPRG